ncbi:MAG: molybdopterin molybdotransferase MoeA [Gammaproteobacteria bacterium]|nr:molybdopterin molybdotransferase MoeA [Gammaproteobacteria bacterium]
MSSDTSKLQPCDEYDPNSLTVEQARERIKNLVTPIAETEIVAIEHALNRVLAKPITSPMDVPPYANSAMDGYAIRAADIPAQGSRALEIVGKIFAGAPYPGQLQAGQCLRIMTGAAIPAGADTVLMQEHVEVHASHIVIGHQHRAGDNVRHSGEDIKKNHVVFPAGHRIKPADMGLLASLGIATVTVARRLRVAFFSSGDELKMLDETLQPGQIYDSNRYALLGLLQQHNVDIDDLGIVADQPQAIRDAFSRAHAADILITTGGVSVGDADYIKQILAERGQVDFWKIAMKPGKPLAFGQLGKTIFFGLPGNPVSAMVTFQQFLANSLQQMSGETPRSAIRLTLRCLSKLKKSPGRVEFQRGILCYDEDELCVKTTGPQGSHVLTSMSQANCYIILDRDNKGINAGEKVLVELM